jgi:hypothetical protein
MRFVGSTFVMDTVWINLRRRSGIVALYVCGFHRCVLMEFEMNANLDSVRIDFPK